MKSGRIIIIVIATFWTAFCSGYISQAAPMGTVITYQGRLLDANEPADGLYDFEFRLFDDPFTGARQGGTIDVSDVDVIDGYFTVELDFGSEVFTGEARWLEIGVRPGDSNEVHTTLSPRQAITAVPYAIYAGSAVSAANVYAGWAEEMTNSSSQITITFPAGKFSSVPGFTASALIKSGAHAGEMAHIPKPYVPDVTATGVTITIQYWDGAVFNNVGDSVEVIVSYVAAGEGASGAERSVGEAGEFDGEVNSDMVEDSSAATVFNFASPFTTTAKPYLYVNVVLKHAADGLVEGAAIKAVPAIKGSAGNWRGFDLTVSKYSDGSSISDTTQVYVKWMALRKE
jgi:hypothetical protein